MIAAALIAEVEALGGTVRLEGADLKLRPAPGKPIPVEIIEKLRAHKAEIFQALAVTVAIMEPLPPEIAAVPEAVLAGAQVIQPLPAEIAEGLKVLARMPAPPDFLEPRWGQTVRGAITFANTWGARALAMKWRPVDLFGLHPAAPGRRYDCRGVGLLLADATVAAMDETHAVVRRKYHGDLRFIRSTAGSEAILAWDFWNDERVSYG